MTTPALAQNSTSTSQPIGNIDRRLSDAVAAFLNTADRVAGIAMAPKLPSRYLLHQISARLVDVYGALRPLDRSIAEKERAAKAVAAVLSGWVNAKVADPAAKVSAYIAVLGDLPCWVVEQVCRDVARGHVDGLDPDYPPSAARLHQLGEQVISRLRKEIADLEAVKNAELSGEPAPSPAERERIALGFQKLSEQLQQRVPSPWDSDRVPHALDKQALAAAQERVRREYAAIGKDPPSPLALSPTALRAIAQADEVRAMCAGLTTDGEI